MKGRKFWKTVNPLFSKKSYSKESSLKKDEIIKNEDLAKTFNNFFSSIVKKLSIDNVLDDESNLPNADDPILKAIAKYENHRISRIKDYIMEERFVVFFQIC